MLAKKFKNQCISRQRGKGGRAVGYQPQQQKANSHHKRDS